MIILRDTLKPIFGKLTWPNPQDSVGQWFSKMGSHNCWEAIGPARKQWRELARDIQKHLEDCHDPVPKGVIWSGYMIGRTKETARPTVVFCSIDPSSRQQVRKLVIASGLLENYPGFRTADCSKPPDFDQLIPMVDVELDISRPPTLFEHFSARHLNGSTILSERDLFLTADVDHSESTEIEQSNWTGQPRPSGYYQGLARFVTIPSERVKFLRYLTTGRLMIEFSSTIGIVRRAAISGPIKIADTNYLFTAAHIFSDSSPIQEWQFGSEEYPNIDIDDDSEDDQGELDEGLITGTSVGSLSYPSSMSGSSGNERTNSLSLEDEVLETAPGDQLLLDISDGNQFHGESAIANSTTRPALDSVQYWVDKWPTAEIRVLLPSESILDYCLIKVPKGGFHIPPSCGPGTQIRKPLKKLDGPEVGNVTIYCPRSDPLFATLSGTPTFISNEGYPRAHELWTVRSTEIGNLRLREGDCGTWVVYSQTGELCGHVIAGSPSSGTAYIVPAYKVFEDIKLRFGEPVLPNIEHKAVENEQRIGEIASAGSPTHTRGFTRKVSSKSSTGIAELGVQSRTRDRIAGAGSTDTLQRRAFEIRDGQGWTQLHHAAFRGDERMVNDLLKLQVSMTIRNDNGQTPLHIAAYIGQDLIVKLLLQSGADKDSRDFKMETPLHIAASQGLKSIVELFINEGADLEATDMYERTPLYVAAQNGHEEVLRLLVGKGANKEATKVGGWVPLHAAAWYGHETVVRLLLEFGAYMEARSLLGETPLFSAARKGHVAIVKLLLDRGAQKRVRANNGVSAVEVAKVIGYPAVVSVLKSRRRFGV